MQKLKLGNINCHTKEEQEMVLDIFEMINYRWRQGENPRGYHSYTPPMSYKINDVENGRFTHGNYTESRATEARDLRNMWISLKRRQK